MSKCFQTIRKLLNEASLYTDLIRVKDNEIRVCVSLSDTDESATLVVANEIRVLEGTATPDVRIIMRRQTLEDIAEGRADAFALAGRGASDEKRPIEFEVLKEEHSEEIWEAVKTLLTYFFTPGKIKIKRLAPEMAGYAHGAHTIPLVYWDGIRFSWILVKQGETLNKQGEKDPWPQAFIILGGKGKATVADNSFEIRPQTAIYIPKDTVHQIESEEDVTLIWLAWNA
ncbi:MAG: cupin domain-containing protein [Candidatus Bathyarchaeia archaeon]